MPGGKPWFASAPQLDSLHNGLQVKHVFDRTYGPLAANPKSSGRCALLNTHAMFYGADSLAGALLETALRNTEPNAQRQVLFATHKLANLSVAQLELTQDVPLLDVRSPALNAWFPPSSKANQAARNLYSDYNHAATHLCVRELYDELSNKWGMHDMPVLAWPSFQCTGSTVYLAYAPPMQSPWWRLVGDPTPLDDLSVGYPLLREALAQYRFTWVPLSSAATRR